MEIIADRLDWTTNDEENLAKFLETETGKRFLPRLLENTPALLEAGETNAIMIRTGMVRGYQEIARTILALAHPTERAASPETAYPNLEDDSKWGDGQTLEIPETKKD